MVREVRGARLLAAPRAFLASRAAAARQPALGGRFALEVFSGCARLSRAFAENGLDAQAWDTADAVWADVLQDDVFKRLSCLIENGEALVLWLGTPCQSFTAARKNDGLGPGPLRSPAFPLGLPGLRGHDAVAVSTGNRLAECSARLFRHAHGRGAIACIENPATSYLWQHPSIAGLLRLQNVVLVTLHYCQFGERWKKPTSLMVANAPAMHAVALTCESSRGICSATGCHHIQLRGRDPTGTFWTLRAQPYPTKLCQLIASTILQQLKERS